MNSKNVFKATNYQYQNDSQRIVDYFCVVGLPTKLTTINNNDEETIEEERDIYYPDDYDRHSDLKLDPIVDLCVLNKSLN